jgi:hypothetical protein
VSPPERPAAEEPAPRETAPPREEATAQEETAPREEPAPPPEDPPPPAPANGSPSPTNGASSGPVAVVPSPPSTGAPDLDGIVKVWPAVLDSLRSKHGELKAGIFERATPSKLSGEELVVSFPPSASFMKRKADDRAYCEALADAVRAVTGTGVLLRCELADEEPGSPAAGEAPTMSEDELIERLKAEFDAEEIPAEEES